MHVGLWLPFHFFNLQINWWTAGRQKSYATNHYCIICIHTQNNKHFLDQYKECMQIKMSKQPEISFHWKKHPISVKHWLASLTPASTLFMHVVRLPGYFVLLFLFCLFCIILSFSFLLTFALHNFSMLHILLELHLLYREPFNYGYGLLRKCIVKA